MVPHCTTLDVDGEHEGLPRSVCHPAGDLGGDQALTRAVREHEDARSRPRDDRSEPFGPGPKRRGGQNRTGDRPMRNSDRPMRAPVAPAAPKESTEGGAN